MATPQTPSAESFAKNFREAIRVGFNWERFLDEKWPIELMTLDTPSDLALCYMPWYIGKNGDEVGYDHPEAVPMRLSDVPKAMAILNEERRADVQEYIDQFQHCENVIQFTAPAYSLPDESVFILDRNHRLSALAMTNVPFDVTLWKVRGPLDPDCLLDLIHWTGQKSDGEVRT